MTIKKRIILAVIIGVVVIGSLVAAIVLTNVLGGGQGATPDEATQPTTVAPTTAQPTTVQPTTAQPTTIAPTTQAKAEAEDEDEFYGGKGGGDTYVDPGNNRDMNGSKDSSSHDVDNEGRHIVYGGNEGYGASTSRSTPSPIPEEQFEERHPLPAPVNPEKDFPDSEVITYDDIQNGKEPEEGDIIQLTPDAN